MANKTVSEARERVRAALVNSGFRFPDKRVTINLAPAELAKDGTHLDLPIALAVLVLSATFTRRPTRTALRRRIVLKWPNKARQRHHKHCRGRRYCWL